MDCEEVPMYEPKTHPKREVKACLFLKLAKGKYDNCYYDLRNSVEESRYGKTDHEPLRIWLVWMTMK